MITRKAINDIDAENAGVYKSCPALAITISCILNPRSRMPEKGFTNVGGEVTRRDGGESDSDEGPGMCFFFSWEYGSWV